MKKLTVMQQRIVDMANMYETLYGPEAVVLSEEFMLKRASPNELEDLRIAIGELVEMEVLEAEFWQTPDWYQLDIEGAGMKPSDHEFCRGRMWGKKEMEMQATELNRRLAE